MTKSLLSSFILFVFIWAMFGTTLIEANSEHNILHHNNDDDSHSHSNDENNTPCDAGCLCICCPGHFTAISSITIDSINIYNNSIDCNFADSFTRAPDEVIRNIFRPPQS